MMNIFESGRAMLQLLHELNRYNKLGPKIDQLHAEELYEEERALIQEGSDRFADSLSKKWKLKYDIQGLENVPEEGPVLIVSNHQSYCDVLMIYYALRKFQIGFIAKSDFMKFKPLATAIGFTRSIFIHRGDARETIKTLNDATELMKKGFSLAIFPEGTRSQCHEMGEFKPGSFKFAQKAKVPILPVTVEGGYHAFEEQHSFKPATFHVRFHPLVHYEELSRKEQLEANVRIEETIRNGLKEFE